MLEITPATDEIFNPTTIGSITIMQPGCDVKELISSPVGQIQQYNAEEFKGILANLQVSQDLQLTGFTEMYTIADSEVQEYKPFDKIKYMSLNLQNAIVDLFDMAAEITDTLQDEILVELTRIKRVQQS